MDANVQTVTLFRFVFLSSLRKLASAFMPLLIHEKLPVRAGTHFHPHLMLIRHYDASYRARSLFFSVNRII
jgi:hypothetical protein